MSSPQIITLPSKELKDLGHETSRLDLGRLEAGTPEPANQAPIRVALPKRFGKWWSTTPMGRWLGERRNRTLALMQSIEAKTSAFLADCANLPVSQCLQRFNSSLNGLNDDQISTSTAEYGPNVLSSAKPPRWWTLLFGCALNPFNLLLTVLAIISIATAQRATFVILMVMVLLSIGLRFWQELKNSIAVTELTKLVNDTVHVVRDGMQIQLSKTGLLPGDIVRLSGGDVVPADVVLVSTAGLYVSQSMLTGENLPVLKQTTDGATMPQSILDSMNICFSGSTIASGSATALVVATGDNTYMGALSKFINQTKEKSEFDDGVRRVSYMLIGFMTIMVPIVLIISGLVSKDWGEAALFCISVAVGLTPEMLPMVINANLCHAAIKLAKLKVIVKRLDSVQTLGAIDVLCSDKTGTLTEDNITLHATVDASNTPSDLAFKYAFLNAFYQEGLRNAIDLSIIAHAESHPSADELQRFAKQCEKVAELPFDFDRRLLSIVVRDLSNAATTMITKGAAEEVIRRCTHVRLDGDVFPLDVEWHVELEQLCTRLNEQGMRIVAVGVRMIEGEKLGDGYDENGLGFEGLLAFLDPPKEDASQAVKDLQTYGVSVKVLTGDSVAAAKAVARKIGLLDLENDDKIISGPELAALDERTLREKAEKCVVFAKLKPLQKQEIVQILNRNGHCVGFLGDGINDAAALRSADVGISVDTGTSVAKHAANIILLQKSLAHVVNGVLYGRITHGNTMKYIKMAASSNFGNIFSVTIAASWLPFVPMAPLQLLVQNLLYDISQAAIPWDHVDPELAAFPRKWNVWSIVRFMIWFGPTSSVFDICTFLLGWYYYGIQTTGNKTDVETFQTQWFTEGLLTQVLVVLMLRTQHIPLVQSRPSKVLGAALVIICVVGLVLPYVPALSSALQMQRPHPTFYGFLVLILISYMLLVQLVKIIYRRVYKDWL